MIRFVLYESYFGLYVVVIRQKRKERGVVRPLYCMGQSVDGSKQWSAVIVESTFMVDFDYQGSGKKMLPEKKIPMFWRWFTTSGDKYTKVVLFRVIQ